MLMHKRYGPFNLLRSEQRTKFPKQKNLGRPKVSGIAICGRFRGKYLELEKRPPIISMIITRLVYCLGMFS